MRQIEKSASFRRDFKKQSDIDAAFIEVLYKLLNNEKLPEKYRDHALTGDWQDYRECHIKPDLLLIYKTINENTLRLSRLGSHSELFG